MISKNTSGAIDFGSDPSLYNLGGLETEAPARPIPRVDIPARMVDHMVSAVS